ncbi:hypothetical protein V4W76_30110, partial [Bacillus thuringiensis]
NIITAQGHAFVPFGIAIASYFGVTNEHNINFYSGKGNVMMEKILCIKKLCNIRILLQHRGMHLYHLE